MAYDLPYRISLIQTLTASSSASLAFTSDISANFSTYLVKVRMLVPATTNTNLLLTFSTDNGSTYLNANYKWGKFTFLGTFSRAYTRSDSDTSIQIAAALSSTSANDFNADIILHNLNSNTFSPLVMCHSTCYNTTPKAQGTVGGGMNTTTTAVTAIKFAMSSGNITSGTISLYGLEDGGFLY